MTPTAMAADLVSRYLDRHGHRRVFRSADDVVPFHRWLHATGNDARWRQARSLAGQASDSGLLDAIEHEHPGLVVAHHDHVHHQDPGGREVMKVKVRLARRTPNSSDETHVAWPATWPPPARGDMVVLADGSLLEVAARIWRPQSEDGPYMDVVAVEATR